jgi:hypothetical protein
MPEVRVREDRGRSTVLDRCQLHVLRRSTPESPIWIALAAPETPASARPPISRSTALRPRHRSTSSSRMPPPARVRMVQLGSRTPAVSSHAQFSCSCSSVLEHPRYLTLPPPAITSDGQGITVTAMSVPPIVPRVPVAARTGSGSVRPRRPLPVAVLGRLSTPAADVSYALSVVDRAAGSLIAASCGRSAGIRGTQLDVHERALRSSDDRSGSVVTGDVRAGCHPAPTGAGGTSRGKQSR